MIFTYIQNEFVMYYIYIYILLYIYIYIVFIIFIKIKKFNATKDKDWWNCKINVFQSSYIIELIWLKNLNIMLYFKFL